MTGLPNNDNTPLRTESHGQAALLLTESLLHGLIAKSVLTVAEAIDIVDIAELVQRNNIEEVGDETGSIQQTIILLQAVSGSLKHDLVVV